MPHVSRVDQLQRERDRVDDASNIEDEDAVRPFFDRRSQLWSVIGRCRDGHGRAAAAPAGAGHAHADSEGHRGVLQDDSDRAGLRGDKRP